AETVLLPNQWSLKPVGSQVTVGDFPVNIQISPDGKFAAVLHCGHGQHEIIVLDVATRKLVSRTPVNEAFYGLAFSPNGTRIFCSGSGDEVVHSFSFSKGFLGNPAAIPLRKEKVRGIPGGIAVAFDGTIYATNVWAHSVSRIKGDVVTEVTLALEAPAEPPARPAELN